MANGTHDTISRKTRCTKYKINYKFLYSESNCVSKLRKL